MNSVSRLSPDDVKMNKFEKSISKSRRDIEDSALVISGKMEPALKAVEASQAAIAKWIAMIPPGIMMGVGAFALMGAGAGTLLMTLKNITMEMKMWGGLGKTAMEGLTLKRSGSSVVNANEVSGSTPSRSQSGAGGSARIRNDDIVLFNGNGTRKAPNGPVISPINNLPREIIALNL